MPVSSRLSPFRTKTWNDVVSIRLSFAEYLSISDPEGVAKHLRRVDKLRASLVQ